MYSTTSVKMIKFHEMSSIIDSNWRWDNVFVSQKTECATINYMLKCAG